MAVKKSELYSLLWEACNKLRGGVEPSRYKDYVLVLLFFKYVSDRYKGEDFSVFTVSEGASFDDLIAAKGKKDVGERVDIIIQKFLEENTLIGSLPDVSFNNPDELGSGKELVDKVSGLIAIFENPAIDFKNNRASGDDIIGDAYEYFMMKFAQESGKSKGQFYTPSEVSRIIARLIGIGEIVQSPDKKWTLHDPAAGSGSLLIRAADEAPVDDEGYSIVCIYGQEKYPDTAGLAKMNFILHNKGTGEIKSGNTLYQPAYEDEHTALRTFDFIVMNPPFSDKDWSDGIKVSEDKYKRFDGYKPPPLKNGDYAWFLHVLKALNSNGKAGIILPHGVLFRGNAEESIRKSILSKRYIKGVISLPENLFYGTGISAAIIIIDKEFANERDGIFFIDASLGFKKDGNKNRLREQDIEKIVQTFLSGTEIEGYSAFVPYKAIIDEHDGNLNINRFITKIDDMLPQNIDAHLNGGIPKEDIDSIQKLWNISPTLKDKIFCPTASNRNVFDLAVKPEDIENLIASDVAISQARANESTVMFGQWKQVTKEVLLNIDEKTLPKILIRGLGFNMLEKFHDALLVDCYDVYDLLLNYWNEKLQDDVYIIKTSGYNAGTEIEYVYAQKKTKDSSGVDVTVDDKSKVKSFDGVLIPRTLIETEYFSQELTKLQDLIEKSALLDSQLDEMRVEESGEEGLLKEVLNEKGDNIPKASLTRRIKDLSEKKTSAVVTDIEQLIELFEKQAVSKMDSIVDGNSELCADTLKNKNGTFAKAKLKTALKNAVDSAVLPEIYEEEYQKLLEYQGILAQKEETDKAAKQARGDLDKMVIDKYPTLTIDEIKHLLFDMKWMAKLAEGIEDEMDQLINRLASKVVLISKRYERTLGEIEENTAISKLEVTKALERMGYKW